MTEYVTVTAVAAGKRFEGNAKVLQKKDFFGWIDSLIEDYTVMGPVREEDQVVFRQLESSGEVAINYVSTMVPPSKLIYPPVETLFRFSRRNGNTSTKVVLPRVKQVLLGVHACDMQGILILDRIFAGDFPDIYYNTRRKNTLVVAVNCSLVGENCFCDSMGTGPFLKARSGYDIVLTDLGEKYLVELASRRGRELISALSMKKPTNQDWKEKRRREIRLRRSFVKKLDTKNLPSILMENLDHPVWRSVGEDRCLSCANCTMVCPTCHCYNVVDKSDLDLKTAERYRYWDSCQDLHFAEVHGGNFRSTRKARLRQFVIHKLSTSVQQYGRFGCVGCGRCITWCPTNIDLTKIAEEVRGKAR